MEYVGGDFNIVMNSSLDTTNQKKNPNHVTKTVNILFKELVQLLSGENSTPPGGTTHYSAPNKSDARIDDFFVNKTNIQRVTECEIGTADMSDHCAVYSNIKLKSGEKNVMLNIKWWNIKF